MTPDILFTCVTNFKNLIGTNYSLHLGRGGKHRKLQISIEKEDFYHLMGLHYLKDRPDKRSRAKIFDEILTSEDYRSHIASSRYWTAELEKRVLCTSILEKILDDNKTIIRFNSNRLQFYSRIDSDYLLVNKDYPLTPISLHDIYLFLGQKDNSSSMFCKSIFTKTNHDFTLNQENWTLLYKIKTTSIGESQILYKHKNYDP